MTSSLLDVLGVFIAFATVMLLLSIVVTALVQATQALFRTRSRNLQRGLTAILDEVAGDDEGKSSEHALQILNAQNVALLGNWKKPVGFFAKLVGPQVSWIDEPQLREATSETDRGTGHDRLSLTDQQVDKLCLRFEQIDTPLKKRFLRTIRLITLGWAIVVAGYFQVSAPALLQELSAIPELRAQYVAAAEDVLGEAQTSVSEIEDFEALSRRAIAQLTGEYPDLAKPLRKTGEFRDNRNDIVADLEAALAQRPEKDQVVARYKTLLQEQYTSQSKEALDTFKGAVGTLAYLNIEPWSERWSFFYAGGQVRGRNWIGVLFTAILLSLGAPTWFEILKSLANLKDALSPPEADKNGDGPRRPHHKVWTTSHGS